VSAATQLSYGVPMRGGWWFAPTMRRATATRMLISGISYLGFQSDRMLVLTEPHPLEMVLRDIERALDAGLWYLALAVSLSIPDICSLLELEEGWSNGNIFAAWFDKHVGKAYTNFTGEDCYKVRGGVLHKGQFGHKKLRYDRIFFSISPSIVLRETMGTNIGGLPGTVLSLDLILFCRTMVKAARAWAKATESDPIVVANLPSLVRLRPDGLPPYIVGLPVIA